MPIRSFTIYQVSNSYVSSGGATTISATFTMTVKDDDGLMQGTAATDTGTPQIFTVNGAPVGGYQFYYNDTISIGGVTQTVKTFQLSINGTTNSFVMSDTGTSIPGAGTGTGFALKNYTGYTPLSYSSLPCFVRGTSIATEFGENRIESLKIGDMIVTKDHGLQAIRWIGSSCLTNRDLLAGPHLHPIKIPAGSFGSNLPKRDLWVSPQHRILLTGWEVEVNFGLSEVLAPAKSLVGTNGISVGRNVTGVDYFHIMFDRHEVIYSEGLASESFLVGDTIRDGMDKSQLAEILELFPELAAHDSTGKIRPARPVLRNFEARILEVLAA